MDWRTLPNAPARGDRLCAFTDLKDGEAKMLNLGEGKAAFPVLLARSGEVVFAYLNRCAHFGVPLAQQAHHLLYTPHQHIECNVHYARYNWQDGRCVSGECAGESLQPIPVKRVGDDICID